MILSCLSISINQILMKPISNLFSIVDTSSVQSDSDFQPTRRSGRRSLEVDLDLPLNNAVLQDLLADVMHHKDSWPFLRPVPRAQVNPYLCYNLQ